MLWNNAFKKINPFKVVNWIETLDLTVAWDEGEDEVSYEVKSWSFQMGSG